MRYVYTVISCSRLALAAALTRLTMSAQKRRAQAAPLPIFSKGKRPRKALLAHPNNVGGQTACQQPGEGQWRNSSYAPTPSPASWAGEWQGGGDANGGSFMNHPASSSSQHGHGHGRDARYNYSSNSLHPSSNAPRPSSWQYGCHDYNTATQDQENVQPMVYQAPPSYSRTGFTGSTGMTSATYGGSWQQSGPAPYRGQQQQSRQAGFAGSIGMSSTPYRGQQQQSGQTGFTGNTGTTSTPFRGKHQPSGQQYSSGTNPSHQMHSEADTRTRLRDQHTTGGKPSSVTFRVASGVSKTVNIRQSSVRVLTATAKGMEHWSKYKHQTRMIFELYGVLCTTVTRGNAGAKEFTLKTADGPVKCVFWEMDRTLPHLVRGHTHRVVGQWDDRGAFLKCYSVRPARTKEEECSREFVRASDHSMRQTIATAHEN